MILEYINFAVLSMLLLFIAFGFFFTLYHKLARLNLADKQPFKTLLLIIKIGFVIADVAVNWIISPLMLDLPLYPTELVTGRLKRYKDWYGPIAGYRLNWRRKMRFKFALWLCARLNEFDKGHC